MMALAPRCPKRLHNSKSNFTIDHILNVAGGKRNFDEFALSEKVVSENKKFDWLNCTRYKPPKLPRQRKKEGIQRRNLGRNPRIPFSSSQVAFLEAKFLQTPYLSSNDVTQLAAYLKLSETRVKIWFQNRRAREKREKESKSQTEESCTVQFSKISSPPSSPQDRFPIDYSSPYKFLKYPETIGYVQILTPLDFSDRQVIYEPK